MKNCIMMRNEDPIKVNEWTATSMLQDQSIVQICSGIPNNSGWCTGIIEPMKQDSWNALTKNVKRKPKQLKLGTVKVGVSLISW